MLSITDVCICSISAPHYIIEKELIQKIAKSRNKELVLIDISMPRNIHPAVAGIKGVRLVGLDELDKVVEYNVRQRQKAVDEVNLIVERQCEEFYKKLNPTSILRKISEAFDPINI